MVSRDGSRFKASQINLFNEDRRGDGVQHIALGVIDIIGAVRSLRASAVEFMRTPPTYYDALPERLRALNVVTHPPGIPHGPHPGAY